MSSLALKSAGFVQGAIVGLLVLLPQEAHAFCRTTVCDERVSCQEDPEICCIRDVNGCDTNTQPIAWPTSCVSFNVHEDGSDKRDISAKTLANTLDDAFDQWLSADCDGGSVSLAVDYRGYAECGEPEYNQGRKDRNANVWMFRDDGASASMSSGDSRLSDAALAVTTVSFNPDNAQIYDVDVELLSSSADFTTGDDDVEVDLASVVTHEAGHFLGLDHSLVAGATMAAGYFPGQTDTRSLEPDDLEGICAAYPEDRSFPGGRTCEPRGKYSPKCEGDGCGCHHAGSDAPRSWMWLVAALMTGLAVFRRRLLS